MILSDHHFSTRGNSHYREPFSTDVLNAASKDAERRFPNESCGLVIYTEDGQVYVPCHNAHPDPANHFSIAQRTVARAMADGSLAGVIHSHPDGQGTPSKHDMVQQIAMGVPWGIFALGRGGRVREYFSFGDHTLNAPLVGQPWRAAVYDCLGLVRRFFWQVHGVRLPDVAREDNWWETDTEAFYHEHRPMFTQVVDVAPSEVQAGDFVLFAIGGPAPNHFGVYTGDNVMLHHMSNGLSARRPLNTLHAKIIKGFRLRPDLQRVARGDQP